MRRRAGACGERLDDRAEALKAEKNQLAAQQHRGNSMRAVGDAGRALPSISVVIATKNREQLLRDTLATLIAQDWPRNRYDILIADNGSTDHTKDVVEAAARQPGAPRIVYRYVATPGKSHAVSALLQEVNAQFIAFTDDDVCPEPEWLRALATAFDETRADFVAGRILPRWETEPPPWLSSGLHGVLAIPENGDARLTISPDGDGKDVMTVGANMAVRTSVVRRIGGFRHDLGKLSGTLRTGEDHEFFLRMMGAGYRGVYEPAARVRHFVPRERLNRQYFRRWLYQNGQDVSRLESAYDRETRRLLGIPRYLWRRAALDTLSMMKAGVAGNERERFAASTRLIWFSGYVRDAWSA
jgi:cellulose synthase/poly-beta-1,6-N-acetylglucosamine synthase-like glycosyltransferase